MRGTWFFLILFGCGVTFVAFRSTPRTLPEFIQLVATQKEGTGEVFMVLGLLLALLGVALKFG